MSDVVVERRGDVVWLRLMRPDRRNAYDAAMVAELTAAVEASADQGGVVVITGTEGSFCAGGFLADLAEPDPAELRRLFDGALRLFTAIRNNPRPVIAAVNGPAVGGGNELVVSCDLAVAAETAFFGQTGPRIGSAPVLGGTNLLAMSVGEKRAREVSFMCRRYPARDALGLGWINQVVADADLESEVTSWANELLDMSPRYLTIAKLSANVWWNACQESYATGLGMLAQAVGSPDMIEGASAFMEKRKPSFPRPWQGGSI
jgi:enoyl-CoA hydratase/carnithine racemase